MIQQLARRARLMGGQIRRGDGQAIVADVRRWTWSSSAACGLRFTRDAEVTPPPAMVPLHTRQLDDDIAADVFDVPNLSSADQLFIDQRREMYDAGFAGGWLAVDEDERPAYLQFLVPPSQRELITKVFGPGLFDVPDDTLLVEGAWIPPEFRKRKVMGEGLALVTQAALASHGPDIRYAQCYPAADNKGAVLGTRSAGYEVNHLRTETWRLGRRTIDVVPATEADFAVFGGVGSN